MHCETWETLYALSDAVLRATIIFVLLMITITGLSIRAHKRGPFEKRLFGYILIAITDNKTPHAMSVSVSPVHEFGKDPIECIKLIEGHGVEGDAHYRKTVQHLSRVRQDPSQPNLRQVHLIQGEILEDLGLQPCDIGENLTTENVDLLGLGRGTKLHFGKKNHGEHAVVEITGLRNPCPQIDKFRQGLKEKFIIRDETRNIVGRKAGVIGVVTNGGEIRKGMKITVEEPKKFEALECV